MLVHGDSPAPPKGGLVLSALCVAVRVSDLADDHHGRGCRQVKLLSHFPIGPALEGQPMPEAFSERDARQPVRRRIEPLEPGDQLGGVRRVQTDSLHTVHQYIISIFLLRTRATTCGVLDRGVLPPTPGTGPLESCGGSWPPGKSVAPREGLA